VVLIADNRSTRQGVLALIRRQPGFRVLASAGLTGEAVRMVRDVRPDIVLLHLGKATDDDALTVAGALHGEAPASRVVVMGLPADSTDLESFIRARVSGFLMANATFSEFLATIDRVVRGEQVLPPALAAGLFAQLTSERLPWHRKPVAGGAALTGRELEVADLIILGRSNKEIATRLGIALHTVKSHVHKVLTSSRTLRVGTMRGVLCPQVLEDGRVRVEMGVPRFEPAEIPFLALRRAATYALQVGAQERAIAALSLGNPHAVQIVADVDTAPVAEEGPLIERHERFPQRVNAGFMQVLDRHAIRLRVYERGAGETLACGTGACAAVAAGVIRNLLDSPVRVETRGGALDIAWSGEGGEVVMSGAACSVFEGEIEIDRQAAACGHTEGAS
jgi:diaminopimelate epimerase